MGSSKYLVIYNAVSAGQNGDNLGCDEEDIVMIVYLILNVEENKIVGVHQFSVKPCGADINDNLLSEEVLTGYGIREEVVKMSPPLETVIGQFDRLAREELGVGEKITLVTDGQLQLRQSLYPEATRKNITLPDYYQRFHDIRKEFQSCLSGSGTSLDDENDNEEQEDNRIEKMLTVLGLSPDPAPDKAVRKVRNMARIVQRMITDGKFNKHDPEIVQLNLEPGIRSRSEQVDTNSVVRARGLPWQASDTDIARFFTGLNVAPGGVALCLSAQGRRNGEALVLFESSSHRDLALRRHKHHIGTRYIEVYKATGEDFISVAGGNNSEAQEFLGRGGQVIIRMRGLPYDCSAQQVIEFFNTGDEPSTVLDDNHGVLFVKKPDGRATGDAFVLFKEETEGEKALQKHKEIIGSRYIELFRSTTAEVQQVLNRSTEPTSKSGGVGGVSGAPPLIPNLPQVPPMAVIPQQLITAGTRKDCIRLRGLPYESQVEHILEFLGDHAKNIVYQGVHMVFNAQGQPSGEAFIQMDSEANSFHAANNRHHRYMVFGKKQRYIEVFQCSGEDMSLVLTGGIAAGLASQQQQKPPLLSPGMLPPNIVPSVSVASLAVPQQGATPQPLQTDPLLALGQAQLAGLLQPQLSGLSPLLFPSGLLPAQHLRPQPAPGLIDLSQLRPPTMQQLPNQQTPLLMLPPGLQHPSLQQLHHPSFQQLQQPGLQQLQHPSLQQLQQIQLQQQQQARFLLPTPGYQVRPPTATISQAGVKRTHEQAFLPGTSTPPLGYPHGAGVLPPKRPPVMYGTAAGPGPGTPTPPPPGPALLPTPPQTGPPPSAYQAAV